MRPGPSTRALAGSVAVGARVEVSRGGVVYPVDIPVSDVKHEATVERVVPSQVSFTAVGDWVPEDPHDPLNNFGQRVRVFALLETDEGPYEVEYGTFQIDSWEETDEGISVTAVDLMHTVVEDPAAFPTSPPLGATLASELQRLAGRLPVVLDRPDVQISREFQWGVDRAEAIRDLCGSYGLAYAVRWDGQLHVWPLSRTCKPVLTYSARDLVLGSRRESRPRIPNQWVVAGTPDGEDGVKWTRTARNFSGHYAPRLYGTVTDRREFASAPSAEAVARAAEAYMWEALSATRVRSVEIAFDPRVEVGDDVQCEIAHDDGRVEHVVGRVVAAVAVLDDPSSRMRLDIKEMRG